jgi:CHAD domain-containing protein
MARVMASTTTEIERKYTMPPEFVLPDLTGLADVAETTGPDEIALDATYYDTADLRLAANRMTLRRREGGSDEGWHLKRPAGVDRTETREPLSAATEVPRALASQVRAVTRGTALAPIVRIRTVRRETTIRDVGGTALAVIADDTVTADRLIGAPETARWRELEVELVAGERSLLDAVEAVLADAGVRPATAPSKLGQALGDQFPRLRDDAGYRRATSDPTMMVTTYLAVQRDAIIDNDPLVRADDPDGVHDMRVAVRRARAALRTYRSLLPRERSEPLRSELHWLAGLLGAVRDGHVLQSRLDHAIDKLPAEQIIGPVRNRIGERLAADRARDRAELAEALDGERYTALLRAFDAVVDDLTVDDLAADELAVEDGGPRLTEEALRRGTRKALHHADRLLGHAIHDGQPEAPRLPPPGVDADDRDVALHEARKAYKRARYAVEVVTPAIGRGGRHLAKRLGELQDVLGDHQDSVVTARLLRDFGIRAHLDGDNAFTYGLLYARELMAGERHLGGLDRARRRAAKPALRRQLL